MNRNFKFFGSFILLILASIIVGASETDIDQAQTPKYAQEIAIHKQDFVTSAFNKLTPLLKFYLEVINPSQSSDVNLHDQNKDVTDAHVNNPENNGIDENNSGFNEPDFNNSSFNNPNFQQTKTHTLDPAKQGIPLIKKMIELLEQGGIQLQFTDDQSYFTFGPYINDPRLMSTEPLNPQGLIYVNKLMLNSGYSTPVDWLTFLKLLFHEVSHKTQLVDVDYRDRIATQFVDAISSFYREIELSKGQTLHVLSIPNSQLKTEISNVSINEAQRSFAVILSSPNNVLDLTEALETQFKKLTPGTRNIITDLERGMYSMFTDMTKMIAKGQEYLNKTPEMQAFNAFLQMFGVKDGLDQLKFPEANISELRRLELVDAEAFEINPGITLLRLSGSYQIGSTGNFTVTMNGQNIQTGHKIPIQLRVIIETDSNGNVKLNNADFHLFQKIDFSQVAQVRQVIRNGDSTSVKIRIKKKNLRKEEVFLLANYIYGHLSIPVYSIEESESESLLEFRIPGYVSKSKKNYFTDLLVLNTESVVPLNRVLDLAQPGLNIASQKLFKPPTDSSAQIVSAGIWGGEKGESVFKSNFTHQEPIPFFQVVSEKFFIPPNQMAIDIVVQNSPGVREVRFQFSRTVNVLKFSNKDNVMDMSTVAKGEFEKAKFGVSQKNFRITESGTLVQSKTFRETKVIKFDQIHTQLLESEGESLVRAQFEIPFKLLKELEPNEAYYIPFITPHSVEVVFEDGSTQTQQFGSQLDDDVMNCEGFLMKSFFGDKNK